MRKLILTIFCLLAGIGISGQCFARSACYPQNPQSDNYAPFSGVTVSPSDPAGKLIWDSGSITIHLMCMGTRGEAVNIELLPEGFWGHVQVSMMYKGKRYDDGYANLRPVSIPTGYKIGASGDVSFSVTYNVQLRLRIAGSKFTKPIIWTSPYRVVRITSEGSFKQYIGDGAGGSIAPETPTCNLIAGDDKKTVTLPTTKNSSFTGSGSTAGRTYFSLMLNNCSSITKSAVFTFDGKSDNRLSSAFANTGTAGNVAIQLGGLSGQAFNVIRADGVNNSVTTSVSGPSPVITLFAEYIATSNTVTPGSVSGLISVRVDYK